MRASATSRTASPATVHTAQAKADANKADPTSPFALLVEATAPPKPAQKDAQNSSGDDKPAAKQSDIPAQTKPATTDKVEKSDKNEDKAAAKTDGEAADNSQNLAVLLQFVDPQTPTSQAAIAAATPINDAAGTAAIDAAAADTKAQVPAATGSADGLPGDSKTQTPAVAGTVDSPADSKMPAPAAPSKNQADTAAAQALASAQAPKTDPMSAAAAAPAASAQTAAAAPSDDGQDEDPQAQVASSNGNVTTVQAPNEVPTKAETKPVAPTVDAPVTAQASVAAQAEDGQGDTSQARPIQPSDRQVENVAVPPPAQAPAKTDAKPAAPKADKPGAVKLAANSKTPSADTSKPDTSKTDAVTPPQAEAARPDEPAPAKPAPAPLLPVNNTLAAGSVAAPQSASVSAPPTTQLVQVTAQPTPNMPALAVEIVAKSQSGARQFDIRLDPPELGRVDVRLSIDATGKASAHLSADQPQTLDLLQKDSSSLTRALRDAGLNVSQDGLNFSLRQQGGNPHGGDGNNNGRPRTLSFTATTSIDATVASAAYRVRSDGRLDIRV